MKTLCRTSGTHTSFLLADLDPRYQAAAKTLEFEETTEGFARVFPADSPHLATSYANFARDAEELILQCAGMRPVRWEAALQTFLQRIAGQHIQWYLVGSAALAARGLDIQPHDIDLAVADADARRLGDLLLDGLIEPVVPVENWFCNWFGRAFLGACVEWVGGVDARGDTPRISDFGPTAASRLETITWRGYQLHVPPLAMQLEANERRGRTERAEKIRRAIG